MHPSPFTPSPHTSHKRTHTHTNQPCHPPTPFVFMLLSLFTCPLFFPPMHVQQYAPKLYSLFPFSAFSIITAHFFLSFGFFSPIDVQEHPTQAPGPLNTFFIHPHRTRAHAHRTYSPFLDLFLCFVSFFFHALYSFVSSSFCCSIIHPPRFSRHHSLAPSPNATVHSRKKSQNNKPSPTKSIQQLCPDYLLEPYPL